MQERGGRKGRNLMEERFPLRTGTGNCAMISRTVIAGKQQPVLPEEHKRDPVTHRLFRDLAHD